MKINDLNDIMNNCFNDRHINVKSEYKEIKKPIFEKVEFPTANRYRENGILTNIMLQSYRIEDLNIIQDKIKIQLNMKEINFTKLSEYIKEADKVILQIASLNSNFKIEPNREPSKKFTK